MPRAAPYLSNFTSGELSPRLEGRVDLAKYFNGVKTMENFQVMPHGGATRRGGTRFVAEGNDRGKVCRLVPFEFNTEQAYVIEFGDLYCRFYRNQGQILEADKTVSGATAADPVVITATSHGYSDGDEVYVSGVVGMTELNGRNFLVANKTANTFELQDLGGTDIDGSGYTAYTSGGTSGKVYQITTPYTEAQLFDLQFAQSADVMYVAHQGHAPRELTRTGHTSWTIAEHDNQEGPFLSVNTTTTTLTPAATTGSGITVTASAVTGINDDAGFRAEDVGRHMRIKHGDREGWGEIVTFNSTTSVYIDISADFGATTASADWRLGAWYDKPNSEYNYPGAVQFFEQRLWWGATPDQPQTIWASLSGEWNVYSPSEEDPATAGEWIVLDTSGLTYTLATDRVNAIRWISAGKVLTLGTTGGEFVVSASNLDEAITPDNVRVVRESLNGSSTVAPKRVRNVVLFMQRAGRKLMEFVFNFEQDAYLAPDLTLLAEHVTQGGITDMDYAQEPDNILWAVRADGQLLGMTYQRDQDVVAWHRHIVGGVSDASDNDAIVESVAVIPADQEAGAAYDEVWISVKRYINSTTVRHIEYFTIGLDDTAAITTAHFTDAGLEYSGASTSTLTNLHHLEGETVSILADGSVHADVTVSGGEAALTRSVTSASVGLPYTSTLETMRLEAGSQDGTAQSKAKRIHEVYVRLLRTVGLKAGPDASNLDVIPFRDSSMAMDEAVDLFTGDKRLAWPKGWETEARMMFVQDQPLPATILSVMPRIKVNN